MPCEARSFRAQKKPLAKRDWSIRVASTDWKKCANKKNGDILLMVEFPRLSGSSHSFLQLDLDQNMGVPAERMQGIPSQKKTRI